MLSGVQAFWLHYSGRPGCGPLAAEGAATYFFRNLGKERDEKSPRAPRVDCRGAVALSVLRRVGGGGILTLREGPCGRICSSNPFSISSFLAGDLSRARHSGCVFLSYASKCDSLSSDRDGVEAVWSRENRGGIVHAVDVRGEGEVRLEGVLPLDDLA